MRISTIALAASLLFASTAFAQQRNQVAVTLSDVGNASSAPNWYGGFGLAYSRLVTDRVAVELSIVSEDRETYDYVVDPATGGTVNVPREKVRIYPVAAATKYFWFNDTPWLPFLGAGIRYVGAPDADPRFNYEDKLQATIVGGVTFKVTPSWGVMVEGLQLLSDRESYDPPIRIAAGVNWRF